MERKDKFTALSGISHCFPFLNNPAARTLLSKLKNIFFLHSICLIEARYQTPNNIDVQKQIPVNGLELPVLLKRMLNYTVIDLRMVDKLNMSPFVSSCLSGIDT